MTWYPWEQLVKELFLATIISWLILVVATIGMVLGMYCWRWRQARPFRVRERTLDSFIKRHNFSAPGSSTVTPLGQSRR